MPTAWFIAPYKRRSQLVRYCAMDDFTPSILTDGGAWAETEILGDAALVKVRASAATLQTIASTTGFTRIPNHTALTDSLSDLTTAQKNAITNKITSLGYTPAELRAALGSDIGKMTLKDLLHLAASRRLKPRYDTNTDTIICDGIAQPVRSIESVDAEVKG